MDVTRITLLKLAQEPNNSFCADCGTSEPRWASWNLGVFICMRCAAIHRKMGTHISKTFVNSGCNARARRLYEALLPDSYIRPQSDSALENFIRAKYEQRKFYQPPIPTTQSKPMETVPVSETPVKSHTGKTDCSSPTRSKFAFLDLIDLGMNSSSSSTSRDGTWSSSNTDLLLCFNDPSESYPRRADNPIPASDLVGVHKPPQSLIPPPPPQSTFHSLSYSTIPFQGVNMFHRQPPQQQRNSNYLNQVTEQLAAIKAQMQSGRTSS
ncbi:unnamed protein product [Echinostoma caproni]|uniref:Arf-GAP domain-containing protein n=1 Tax=Echinostoma caproni TaxID=27848 RepID=A0A183AMU2_9TREM|nr:unnamed protein product [Echinostoma caproni]